MSINNALGSGHACKQNNLRIQYFVNSLLETNCKLMWSGAPDFSLENFQYTTFCAYSIREQLRCILCVCVCVF